MKTNEIKVGEIYVARVSGNLVRVQVKAIRERFDYKGRSRTVFDVINLKTKRTLTFRSAQKFRGKARPEIENIPATDAVS